MRARSIWGLVLVGGALFACMVCYQRHTSRAAQNAAAAQGEYGQSDGPLLGKWIHMDGNVATCYEFRADGTCTRTMSVDKGSESVSGKWMIDDGGVLRIALNNGDFQGAEVPHQIRVDSENLNFIEDGVSGQFTRPR